MKKIKLFIIAIVAYTTVFAQHTDQVLGRINYTFSYVKDTTQRDKPYTENMLLIIGKDASIYTSYDKIVNQVSMNKQFREQVKNNAGGAIMLSAPINKRLSDFDYFLFIKENKFFVQEQIVNDYITEEPFPKIDWTLHKDTLSFSGIHCKKGTAHFKGRNWIAWYAPELPFQSGPWKLNGLPGLIISAYDEKKDIQFQFSGFENLKDDKIAENSTSPFSADEKDKEGTETYTGKEIKLPPTAIRTTKVDLDKLKEARTKDPQGFMRTAAAANGISVSSAPNGSGGASAKPRVNKMETNNPMELPEKNE